MDDELLLRPGVPVQHALDTLRDLILQADNIASTAGGEPPHKVALWADDAELYLRSLFVSPAVWQALYTDRHWELRRTTDRGFYNAALVRSEATWQRDRLQGIRDRLQRDHEHFALPDDTSTVVPDTNVFIHYEFYEDVKWEKLTNTERIRLVIPHLVVDELDSVSFRSHEHSDRARSVIKSLRLLRGDTPPEVAVALAKNRRVELQFMMDPPGHRRRASNDDEILARAEYLAAFVGSDRVHVVAGDYGMQLGAVSRGLHCIGADQLKPLKPIKKA